MWKMCKLSGKVEQNSNLKHIKQTLCMFLFYTELQFSKTIYLNNIVKLEILNLQRANLYWVSFHYEFGM